MGKKKKAGGKAGKAKAEAAGFSPKEQSAEEVVAATLAACFPDEDGDAREVAAEMLMDARFVAACVHWPPVLRVLWVRIGPHHPCTHAHTHTRGRGM